MLSAELRTETKSDAVIVNVLSPSSRQNDTDTVIDSTTVGRHRNAASKWWFHIDDRMC